MITLSPKPIVAGLVLAVLGAPTASAQTHTVGDGERYATLSEALSAADDGDTVLVRAGVYTEHAVVRSAVVLRGEEGAVLHGGGEGVVLTIMASAHVSGLTIRGSGRDLSREDAGILVLDADDVKIEDVTLEDVLFGIYAKQSDRAIIRNNDILGKPLPIGARGDGIRLWYCQEGVVAGNRLDRTRDLVIWFSSGFEVRDNVVENSRYGLHYMYSDHNRFEGNEFRNNHVGAFLMYSKDIEFRANLFLEAYGPSGIGLGIKDSDDIEAEGNAFVGNSVGLTLDNSPSSLGVTNGFRGNLFAYNDIGVSLLPSVRSNAFEENTFVENLVPVTVSGGGDALANRWRGNYWGDYAGFDADHDRVGDTPYRHERVADELYARYPQLRWFVLSPAAGALELLGRMFPLLRPQPVVVDSAPLLDPRLDRGSDVGGLALAAVSPSRERASGERIAAGVALCLLGVAAFAAVTWAGRRRVAGR